MITHPLAKSICRHTRNSSTTDSMNSLMTAPGALRSNTGDLLVSSTMSLEAQTLGADRASSVRIVLTDTLPGGSEMEVTLKPEQAAAFAVSLNNAAKAALETQDLVEQERGGA
jgi:hypothetical protein